ncbi:MAG TPA: hypothetical protein VK581_13615 [Chthoniobacterales bacterium]|nr:hypothetical protein [Chthoniobacterales bacterium]
MTPENAKARDQAVEVLIAASLRAPTTEPDVTDDQILRYLDQNVTLSSADEAALQTSRQKLRETVRRILHGEGEVEQSPPAPAKFDLPKPQPSKRRMHASEEFVEAVVIAQLTRSLADPTRPLGRKRCQKFSYLSHRKADEDVTKHFLKKAAGPYSPWARYQGPETIAIRNGYVERAKVGVFTGLVASDNIDNIDQYLSHYPVCAAVEWIIETLRWRKNDELELLATVDFAAVELRRANTEITWTTIKNIIARNPEWAPKLDRAVFSDCNIAQALSELQVLFPASYVR